MNDMVGSTAAAAHKTGGHHHSRASIDLSFVNLSSSAEHAPAEHRPTSEIFMNSPAKNYQTPEAAAMDQWLRDLQHYEQILEEMAAASIDENFKEELSAIEQWFKVLSEAERTTALYSLLQHANPVQIRFFQTILQQMQRNDPLAALLSPNVSDRGSDAMSSRIELSYKPYNNSNSSNGSSRIPGDGRPQGSFPNRTSRIFSAGTPTTPIFDTSHASSMFPDAATALAHHRAKLTMQREGQESSLPSPGFVSGSRSAWGEARPLRPKSADISAFGWKAQTASPSALLKSARQVSNVGGAYNDPMSPFTGDNWASMMNTPVHSNFSKSAISLDQASLRLASLNISSTPTRVVLDADVRKYRRPHHQDSPKTFSSQTQQQHQQQQSLSSQQQQQMFQHQQNHRNASTGDGLGQIVPQSSSYSNVNLSSSPKGTGPYTQCAATKCPPGIWSGAIQHHNQSPKSSSPVLVIANSDNSADGSVSPSNNNNKCYTQVTPRVGHNSGISNTQVNPLRRSLSSHSPSQVEDPCDPVLLNDIVAWLRALRLHKYTENLKHIPWQELIELDNEALEKKGIGALGARRKLLKTFEIIKDRMKNEKI